MRHVLSAALLAIAVPIGAQAPNVTITGRVTTESGVPIDGANVYINDLGISTFANSAGNYSIVIPNPANRALFGFSLRLRATGYIPQVEAVRITIVDDKITWIAGSNKMDFVMKRDPNQVTDHIAVERARVPFSVPRQDNQNAVTNVPGQADPFGRFLFPPELVMQHQGALQLSESQREALQNAIQEAQSQVLKMQWALAGEGEKLTKLLTAQALEEKEVLTQVDRILMTEREIKRAQMILLVKIRNALTPVQQQKLREARGGREEERRN